MNNARKYWLVAYDIADPRRLARVHRVLSRHGLRLQYSLYLAQTTGAGLQALLDELRPLIDRRADDVRAYPVPARVELTLLGRRALPQGALLCSTELAALLADTETDIKPPTDAKG